MCDKPKREMRTGSSAAHLNLEMSRNSLHTGRSLREPGQASRRLPWSLHTDERTVQGGAGTESELRENMITSTLSMRTTIGKVAAAPKCGERPMPYASNADHATWMRMRN